jgi:hypothetical protein
MKAGLKSIIEFASFLAMMYYRSVGYSRKPKRHCEAPRSNLFSTILV